MSLAQRFFRESFPSPRLGNKKENFPKLRSSMNCWKRPVLQIARGEEKKQLTMFRGYFPRNPQSSREFIPTDPPVLKMSRGKSTIVSSIKIFRPRGQPRQSFLVLIMNIISIWRGREKKRKKKFGFVLGKKEVGLVTGGGCYFRAETRPDLDQDGWWHNRGVNRDGYQERIWIYYFRLV